MTDWQQLPESSRACLVRIADQMRRGFTGRFEIECNNGGVAQLTESQVTNGKELKHGKTT